MIRSLFTVLVASTLVACAASPPPLRVRASELGKAGGLAPGQALVIELQPGDELPLEVSVDGALVRTPVGMAPIPLTIKRRFFLRIDEDGLATSLDGITFGDHVEPGAFSFGIGATPREGTRAKIAIRTPTPREPGR